MLCRRPRQRTPFHAIIMPLRISSTLPPSAQDPNRFAACPDGRLRSNARHVQDENHANPPRNTHESRPTSHSVPKRALSLLHPATCVCEICLSTKRYTGSETPYRCCRSPYALWSVFESGKAEPLAIPDALAHQAPPASPFTRPRSTIDSSSQYQQVSISARLRTAQTPPHGSPSALVPAPGFENVIQHRNTATVYQRNRPDPRTSTRTFTLFPAPHSHK